MKVPTPYSRDELRELEAQVAAGEPTCPLCDGALDSKAVPPRADVSYVRDRVWLTCRSCDRHGVVDRPRSAHLKDDDRIKE